MMGFRRMITGSLLAAGLMLFGAAAPALGYPGDFDGDGDVDLSDLAALLGCYNCCDPDPCWGECEAADFDVSGCVDLSDLATLLGNYGTSAQPDMVLVAAGEFEMGDSFGEGNPDELPVHDVYLDAYYIDTYEVTNEEYCVYLNSAYGQGLIHVSDGVVYKIGGTSYPYCDTHSADTDSRIYFSDEEFTITAGKEDHPMVEVSWYGAAAYSNWRSDQHGRTPCYNLDTWACNFDADGFRLPTEAEWEKAAGWDPAQSRHFRFGEHTDGCGYNCLDGQRANYDSSGDPYETGARPETTPVGFYSGDLHYKADFGWPGSETSYQTQDAQSYYGCRDMSGNVWEWCHDRYDSGYYTSSPYDNPTGPASGSDRVSRDGYWSDHPSGCRSTSRIMRGPGDCGNTTGFRCVAGTP